MYADSGRWQALDFAVRPPGFPILVRLRERAATLAYLMAPKPYMKLMSIHDHDSLQSAVIHFWKSHVRDSAKFCRVAAKYYRRAEQANRLFSTYKVGWKTDTGMVYILYGPPAKIYSPPPLPPFKRGVGSPLINSSTVLRWVRWVTSHHHNGCDWHFDFYQLRPRSPAFPFDQLFLAHFGWRTKKYIISLCHRAFRAQRQVWLTGSILEQ